MPKPASSSSSSIPSPTPDWLVPIRAEAPCGESLEYDPEYAVLLSRMTLPRGEAQYGDFVGVPEAPNWAEIERDCRRLLLRTRDIPLMVWLCRARTRLAQAAGLAQGLSMLSDVLQAWPEAIHPQVVIEGQSDPEVRANALGGLADPEGLLADVREIVVAPSTAMRLTVRDVERAFAVPRAADAQSAESVGRQLDALRATGDASAPVYLLAQAARHAHAIDAWARSQLAGHAPRLDGLLRVLDFFDTAPAAAKPAAARSAAAPEPSQDALEHARALRALLMPSVGGDPRTRGDVLSSIRDAREWFEAHEPSSPVAVLLRQAERMVGKRFSEVADSIPLDLLHKWERDEQSASRETPV